MRAAKLPIRRLRRDRCGAVATEYAFVVAFIALVSAVGMAVMGANLSSFYISIGSALDEIECQMPDTTSDNGQNNSNKCKEK